MPRKRRRRWTPTTAGSILVAEWVRIESAGSAAVDLECVDQRKLQLEEPRRRRGRVFDREETAKDSIDAIGEHTNNGLLLNFQRASSVFEARARRKDDSRVATGAIYWPDRFLTFQRSCPQPLPDP